VLLGSTMPDVPAPSASTSSIVLLALRTRPWGSDFDWMESQQLAEPLSCRRSRRWSARTRPFGRESGWSCDEKSQVCGLCAHVRGGESPLGRRRWRSPSESRGAGMLGASTSLGRKDPATVRASQVSMSAFQGLPYS
jgi:hypothetical protein